MERSYRSEFSTSNRPTNIFKLKGESNLLLHRRRGEFSLRRIETSSLEVGIRSNLERNIHSCDSDERGVFSFFLFSLPRLFAPTEIPLREIRSEIFQPERGALLCGRGRVAASSRAAEAETQRWPPVDDVKSAFDIISDIGIIWSVVSNFGERGTRRTTTTIPATRVLRPHVINTSIPVSSSESRRLISLSMLRATRIGVVNPPPNARGARELDVSSRVRRRNSRSRDRSRVKDRAAGEYDFEKLS